MTQTQYSTIPYTKADFERIGKSIEEFTKSSKALSKNGSQLRKEFPQQWVAYFDEKLCGHNEDLDTLIAQLKKEGISVSETAIKFMETKQRILIL